MTKQEACRILGIAGMIDALKAKAAYRQACAKYHPDRNPAGLEMMKAVNQAWDALRDCEPFGLDEAVSDHGEQLDAILNSIIDLEGVEIEICGCWIWLSGDTRQHKEALKAAGFWWANQKKQWYWKPADSKRSKGRGMDMEEIRSRHGSERVTAQKRPQRAALTH